MQGSYMVKYFILNADDFGMTNEYNKAVLKGYNNGFLTSASLCANGEAFESAINEILPECPNLSIGVHLNIIEGKSLTKCPLLTDSNGYFNRGYLYFILNQRNPEFLKQVEAEFRAQIEKIKEKTTIYHVDSHVHTHAIPGIFKIAARLANEYKIQYIRTQFEKFYIVPDLSMHINLSYPINLIKIILLNTFTKINQKIIQKYNLKTNNYLIGVGYTGMMNSKTLQFGLKAIKSDSFTECLIHPCVYNDKTENSHTKEYAITVDKLLEDTIKRYNFEITSFKKLNDE